MTSNIFTTNQNNENNKLNKSHVMKNNTVNPRNTEGKN